MFEKCADLSACLRPARRSGLAQSGAVGKLPCMQTTTPWDTLAGQYQLHPGAAPSIVGQRPVLGAGRLGQLLRGQRGAQVSARLGSIFTLCSHAHRRTADLALAAAQTAMPITPPAPVLLALETARDHLRSVALDWPQRLPDAVPGAPALDWLRGCPLPLVTARPVSDAAVAWQTLAALRSWLEDRVLDQDATQWLVDQRAPDALACWCQAHADRLPTARCLSVWWPLSHALRPMLRSLDLLDTDAQVQRAQLQPVAQMMATDVDFVQHPTWLGQCAETGAWSRLRHRSAPLQQHSAWTRLSARWIEFIEIAAATPDSATPLLASGALHLAPGQALAWCEMARGLLLHWVQLDGGGAVQDYRVLAPTEWNFHPDGALAKALAALAPHDTAAARALAAAFDPCVACTV